MKPWEKYQAPSGETSTNESTGPWQNYQTKLDSFPGDQVAASRLPQKILPDVISSGVQQAVSQDNSPFFDSPTGGLMDLAKGGAEGLKRFNEGINQFGSELEERFPVLESMSQYADDLTGGVIGNAPPPDFYDEHYVKPRRAEYDASPGANTKAAKVGRFVGENGPAMAVPAARFASPTVVRLVGNALAGGATAGMQYTEEGDSRLNNTIAGAGLSALGGEAARILILSATKAARAMSGAFKSRNDKVKAAMGAIGEDIPQHARRQVAEDIADGLTPEQALRKHDFESIGVKPTKAKITNNPTDLALEDRLINKLDDAEGVGDGLRDLTTQNNRSLLDNLDNQVMSKGGNFDDAYDVGESVKVAIDSGKKKFHTLTREAYEQVKKEHGDNIVQPKALIDEMRELIDLAPEYKGVESLLNRMKRFGIVKGSGDLNEGIEVGSITVRQSEELRKMIGSMVNRAPGHGKSDLAGLKTALATDVENSIGSDAFASARKVAVEEFGTFDNRKIVKAIMSGKLTPDNTIDRVISKSWSKADIEQLVGTLDKAKPQALKDLRAGVMRRIADGATEGRALNSTDDYIVSGANLKKVIERIGRPKLRALFGEKEAIALARFADATHKFTNKVRGTFNPSGTAGRIEQMVSLAVRSARAVRGIPGVGNIADGWLSAFHNKQLQKAAKEALDPVGALKKANKKAARQSQRKSTLDSGSGQESARFFREHKEEDD